MCDAKKIILEKLNLLKHLYNSFQKRMERKENQIKISHV